MKSGRGRLIALSSMGLGLAVLTITAFALKDHLLEEYWLRKLEKGDESERRLAAERLGQVGSLRSVLPLLSLILSTKGGPGPATPRMIVHDVSDLLRRPEVPEFLITIYLQRCLPGSEQWDILRYERGLIMCSGFHYAELQTFLATARMVRSALMRMGRSAVLRMREIREDKQMDERLRAFSALLLADLESSP